MGINKKDLVDLRDKLEHMVNSGNSSTYSLKLAVLELDEIINTEYGSPSNLTKRQRDICFYLIKGFTNREIASALNISIKTVEFHLKTVYEKLDCSNRSETIAFIVENQILSK